MRLHRFLLTSGLLILVAACSDGLTEPATRPAAGAPRLSTTENTDKNKATADPLVGTTAVASDTTGRAGPGLGSGH